MWQLPCISHAARSASCWSSYSNSTHALIKLLRPLTDSTYNASNLVWRHCVGFAQPCAQHHQLLTTLLMTLSFAPHTAFQKRNLLTYGLIHMILMSNIFWYTTVL